MTLEELQAESLVEKNMRLQRERQAKCMHRETEVWSGTTKDGKLYVEEECLQCGAYSGILRRVDGQ